MAKAKNRSKKSAPRTKAKAAAVATKPAGRRAPKAKPALLDTKAKQKLLKPPTDWIDLAFKAVDAWGMHRKFVRVKDGTPAKLRSMLRGARLAQKRAAAAEQAAQRANDAVLVVNDRAWRLVLAAYGIAQASAKTAPEVLQAFSFLADAFARPGAAPQPAASGSAATASAPPTA